MQKKQKETSTEETKKEQEAEQVEKPYPTPFQDLLNEKKVMHPNSLKNLKHFQKGNTIGKAGRPKGSESTKTRLKKLLGITKFTENPITGIWEEVTIAELMDAAIAKKAMKGDVKAYAEILDRFEGKVKQRIEQENTIRSVVIDTTGNEMEPKPIEGSNLNLLEGTEDPDQNV